MWVPLSVGRNVITIEVTAEDGSTRRTYTVTVRRSVVTGELSTDRPRVNFRVTGYSTSSAGVAWEVPRNRGITRYSLQRYKHNGISYVAERGTAYIDGATNGGAGHSLGHIALEPDTRYKYVLDLINDLDMTVIEKSATVRTLSTSSTSASSTDASLSNLTLSGVGAFGPFSFRSSSYSYNATTTNSVTQTTVTPTVNHSGASYEIRRNGTVDSDGVIPLSVGGNVISVEVTAEDGVVTRVYTVTVTRAGLPLTIGLSPASPVTEGRDVTVTLSFGGLTLDSSANHTYRADVLGSDGSDANVCEGTGMGVNQDMDVVDEDPEVRTVAVSADCGPGVYSVEVSLTSKDNVKLAFATAPLSLVGASLVQLEQRLMDRYDDNENGVIDSSEILTAVRDYFAGDLTGEEILTLVRLYFAR